MQTQAQIVAALMRDLSDEALQTIADVVACMVYEEGFGDAPDDVVREIVGMVEWIPVEMEG